MILVMDAGNTNISFAVMDGERIVHNWSMNTHDYITIDMFQKGFAAAGVKPRAIAGGMLASVVPFEDHVLREYFRALAWKNLLVMGDDNVKLNIAINVENPKEVGADRIANAVAGAHYYGGPVVIVDFGTATTFDVVGPKRDYLGGAITTGIGLSVRALHEHTAKLPLIDIEPPASGLVTGKNTREAMKSGLYFGYLSMVEGMIDRLRKEYGNNLKTISTGGFSHLLAGQTKALQHHRPDLTLQGLRLIYEHNANG